MQPRWGCTGDAAAGHIFFKMIRWGATGRSETWDTPALRGNEGIWTCFIWQMALNFFEGKFQRGCSQALPSSKKLRCSVRGGLETQTQKKSCHQKCSAVLKRFPTEVTALLSLNIFGTWQVKCKYDPSSTGHSRTLHVELSYIHTEITNVLNNIFWYYGSLINNIDEWKQSWKHVGD